MAQSYLFEIIKTLQPDELREVAFFAASPIFNSGKSREEVRQLLSLILTTAPDSFEHQLKKGEIYRQLFPGERRVVGKLEKIMAELNKLVRAFLLLKHYLRDENEFDQTLDLAALLRKRGLDVRFSQTIRKLEKLQETETCKDSRYYHRQFLLEFEKHDWESLYNRKKGDINVPQVVHNLDIYYHICRLELMNRLLLQQKVTQVDFSEQLPPLFFEAHLPKRYLEESPVLLITEKIHRLLKAEQPGESEFYILADLLRQHEREISPDLTQQFYTYLRSLCSLRINFGFKDFRTVLHRIHRDNLEMGHLYYEGRMPSGTFGNVVTVALRIKKFEWAFHFIDSHKDLIIGDNESRDFYRLNLASYYFETNDFERALDIIPGSFQDLDYHFGARRLRLKIYHEINSDLLFYELDAFKMLVSRSSKKTLSPQMRELQGNFANFLYQIVHSPPNNKDRALRLIQRIQSKSVVADKDWLLEKAGKLARI